jgi:antirestriction protein ArdC
MENTNNTPQTNTNANNQIKRTTVKEKYNQVVENFIKKLENNDTEPWTKSWVMNASLPRNFESGNSYSGMNILTLLDRGFTDSRFLTMNQVNNLGGKVIKGEKSTPIFFMKPMEKEVEDEITGEKRIEKYFIMQSYNVFNITQTQGIKYEPEIKNNISNSNIQHFIDSFNIKTFRGEPAYSPSDDCIFMPHYQDFESENEFYSTYMHELTHYTGHSSRLDRFEKHTVFGDERYAFEELIAELGSAFLSLEHGIKPNSKKQASYLNSWITALKERPNILYSAASHATKSTNYLMNNYYLKEQIKNQHNNNLQNTQTMQNNQVVNNTIQNKPKKNFSPKVG